MQNYTGSHMKYDFVLDGQIESVDSQSNCELNYEPAD